MVKKNLLNPEVIVASEGPAAEQSEVEFDDWVRELDADAEAALPPPTPVAEPSFDTVDSEVVDDAMADDHELGADRFGMDVDMLVSMGVTPADAYGLISSIMDRDKTATFYEFYGRGGLNAEASRSQLGIKGLGALDFACPKADGSLWDFSRATDRQDALRMVEEQDPDWIIGSPPCTSFSVLNHGLNFPKMHPDEVQRRVDEGMKHIKFVVKLYKSQMRRGKWFLHEHPRSALSWKTKPILDILKEAGVMTTVSHQCMFGLHTPGPNGTPMLAKKPTRWMTNSASMIEALTVKCDKTHIHRHLMGGRAAAAAFYPPKLLKAIVLGMARTRDVANGLRLLAEDKKKLQHEISALMKPSHNNNDEPNSDTIKTKKAKVSSLPLHGGGTLPLTYDDHNFKEAHKDEYT